MNTEEKEKMMLAKALAKMKEQDAVDLSDSEIVRCLSACVASTRLIDAVRKHVSSMHSKKDCQMDLFV